MEKGGDQERSFVAFNIFLPTYDQLNDHVNIINLNNQKKIKCHFITESYYLYILVPKTYLT
ncbi:hypothetical protein DBV15_06149 [Temnothorax longispinosus]|uniref:Uncharacterized protein n=1 Tax=Temnothorax longispinosus TaxID=300112 RepID=A0A4V6RGN5_9HYME|nr:hypothetical protein DBV15_06149 [Temnothorax longispinosus]